MQDNTGFELAFDDDIGVTEPPTERELAILRKLDPDAPVSPLDSPDSLDRRDMQ